MKVGPFLDAAADLVLRRTGLVFSESRRPAFESGLATAMRRAKLPEPELYLASLAIQPALLDDLVGEITIGETYFFREQQQWAVIRDQIVPDLMSRRPGGPALRVWSAGCATGEEAYTLAIVMRELSPAEAPRIVGTDISRVALATARRASYTRWSLRGVSDLLIQSHFARVGERFELPASLREAVEFRYLNLAEDIYPSLPSGIWGMDLILCRNVLIYLERVAIERVARRLIDSLSKDGWLLLGASDPPLAGLVPCDVVVTDAGLAYRRAEAPVRRQVATSFASVPEYSPVAPLASTCEPTPTLPHQDASDGAGHAARCYAERDYQRAAELADRALQADGSDPALWIVLVRALANRGELAAAGQACAAALDRHRASAELAYLHAVLLAEGGRHQEAAAAARRALYLDRGLIVAHLTLGNVLAHVGDGNGARRAVQNAQLLLAGMAPEETVPASDGEPAGRLAEMARVHLQLLEGAAA
jgi:chemotaxis protein methyltransferase CheR